MSKTVIGFQAPIFSRSGYGDHSRDLLKSLIAMDGFDVKCVPTNWGDCPSDSYPEFEKYILRDQKQQIDVFMQVSVPNEFKKVAKYNIGITAGIETTQAPAEWIEGCNRMDRVIVPSHHSRQILLDTIYDKRNDQSGDSVGQLKCEVPIDVLFEGIDTDIFKKVSKAEIPSTIVETLDEIKEDFCFLYTGHWIAGNFGHDRKDVSGTIKTFIETFKNTSVNKRPALVLKTSGATFSILEYNEIDKKISQITEGYDNPPNIYVLEGKLSEDEMNGLYNHPKVKAMVSLTHGEGYGRPLAEFSITQKPLIVSNWSGQVDFITHAVKLPGSLREVDNSAANNMILKGSKWFYVDYGYASNILKDVFKNYKKYIPDARKQARLIREDFNLDEMTKAFEGILNSNLPKFAKKIKLNVPKLEKVNG